MAQHTDNLSVLYETTEWRRIRALVELSKRRPAQADSGLAARVGLFDLDDCAVIPLTAEVELVVGTDFIRGEDFNLFRAGYLTLEDLGYYLVGANASDLAAMGAAPIGIVTVVRYNPEMTDEQFTAIMGGVVSACADMGIPLLGGDSGSYPKSVMSAASWGTCPIGRALLRSGGCVGDMLFASGDFGTAGAALQYFTKIPREQRSLSETEESALLESWRKVKPALRHGQFLVANSLSKCATDTSDGLKVSCEQIAAASCASVVVSADKVPVSRLTKKVASLMGKSPLELAFGDSVDFRLVFTVPQESVMRARHLFAESALELIEIGRIEAATETPGATLELNDGDRTELPGIGWRQ